MSKLRQAQNLEHWLQRFLAPSILIMFLHCSLIEHVSLDCKGNGRASQSFCSSFSSIPVVYTGILAFDWSGRSKYGKTSWTGLEPGGHEGTSILQISWLLCQRSPHSFLPWQLFAICITYEDARDIYKPLKDRKVQGHTYIGTFDFDLWETHRNRQTILHQEPAGSNPGCGARSARSANAFRIREWPKRERERKQRYFWGICVPHLPVFSGP